MAVQEIRLLGNPVLRTRCEKVKDFSAPVISQTIGDLFDTLENFRSLHGFGRGIAAPQIGLAEKIIAINIDRPLPLLNPHIVRRSKQMMTLWDDCFSFPEIVVKVKRHAKIAVEYQNEEGKKQQLEAVGGLSELLQHEIDHINGILAIDRAIDSNHIILRSEWNKITASQKASHPL